MGWQKTSCRCLEIARFLCSRVCMQNSRRNYSEKQQFVHNNILLLLFAQVLVGIMEVSNDKPILSEPNNKTGFNLKDLHLLRKQRTEKILKSVSCAGYILSLQEQPGLTYRSQWLDQVLNYNFFTPASCPQFWHILKNNETFGKEREFLIFIRELVFAGLFADY
jgi:hypothetical protein